MVTAYVSTSACVVILAVSTSPYARRGILASADTISRVSSAMAEKACWCMCPLRNLLLRGTTSENVNYRGKVAVWLLSLFAGVSFGRLSCPFDCRPPMGGASRCPLASFGLSYPECVCCPLRSQVLRLSWFLSSLSMRTWRRKHRRGPSFCRPEAVVTIR